MRRSIGIPHAPKPELVTLAPALDPILERDTRPLLDLPATAVLLADDSRWPWLILVPRERAVHELHELDPDTRDAFLRAVSATSEALQRASGCRSVNVAMLGNVVAQLHCHVVARSPGDPNWPRPVWGFGAAVPYPDGAEPAFAVAVREALSESP